MKFLLITSTIMAISGPMHASSLQIAEINKSDTIPKLISGFYLAVVDSTKSIGFKADNKDNYYFLSLAPALILSQVDSMTKEYDNHRQSFLLVFHFNKSGSIACFDFTAKHRGEKIALVLNNKIIWTATVYEAVDNVWIGGNYTESQIDSLEMDVGRELKKLK